ncbi:MAG TPA: hypothetical protein VF597_01875, partial [Candidatus Saccharimonadales bacterium]
MDVLWGLITVDWGWFVPLLLTFIIVGIFIAIAVVFGRKVPFLWLLPAILLAWGKPDWNFHGGFFGNLIGFIVWVVFWGTVVYAMSTIFKDSPTWRPKLPLQLLLGFIGLLLVLTVLSSLNGSPETSTQTAVVTSVPSETVAPEVPDNCPPGETKYLGPEDSDACYAPEDQEESPSPAPQPSGGVDCQEGHYVSFDRSPAARQARLALTDEFNGRIPDVEAFRDIVARLAMHETGTFFKAYVKSPWQQKGDNVLTERNIADGHDCYGPVAIRAYNDWLPSWQRADISPDG